jgi:uncharacterized protein (TIGR02117 family)
VSVNAAWRLARWGAFALAAPVLLFALAGWLGSAVPRNPEWREPAEPGVAILLGTNGVHTEIVMPLVTPHHDWRAIFPLSKSDAYTHVAVSWGERAFFLETPRWSALDPLTALRAIIGGEALLHVERYAHPRPSPDQRILMLRPAEYEALARQIAQQIVPGKRALPGYGAHDAFYPARGAYHLGNTCNQWTSDQLAASGIRTGWWTPFPGGVMKWVPPASRD